MCVGKGAIISPMGTKSLFFLGIFLLFLVGGGGLYLSSLHRVQIDDRSNIITNFEECVEAGNPVMESYPRQCRDSRGNTYAEDIGNELEKRDLIRIENPRPNTTIASPLILKGEARGTWYFEASFPVDLYDADGNLLLQTFAEAQADWMTEDFVPFQKRIVFGTPPTATGVLVLRKDNPSGLPQHDDELRIPVVFDRSENLMITTIHVLRDQNIEEGADCRETVALERTTPHTAGVARAALNELLLGVTEEEKVFGYSSAIPENVALKSLRIEEGVALVDFNGELNDVAGSCRVEAIRAQIENTLFEFPIVEEVIISIEGKTEEILQP